MRPTRDFPRKFAVGGDVPWLLQTAMRSDRASLLSLPFPRLQIFCLGSDRDGIFGCHATRTCCKGVIVLPVVAAEKSAVLQERCSIYLSNV